MAESLHIVCPHCSGINRVVETRLHESPKCGKCQQVLFSAKPVELNANNFKQHISRSDIPVVVDFWAPWCGPCKSMAPAFVEAAAQLEPNMRVAKVNTENEQAIAAQYGIRSIPTLIVFKNGQEVARQAGAMAAADIVKWAKQ